MNGLAIRVHADEDAGLVLHIQRADVGDGHHRESVRARASGLRDCGNARVDQ